MKKDILAALTFIMTGLLFYVVQTDSKVQEMISTGIECEAEGTVVVGEAISDAAMEITLQAEVIKDS